MQDDDDVAINEPHEFCLSCDTLLPMSQLSKHIIVCQRNEAKDRYDNTIMISCMASMCTCKTASYCTNVYV